MDDGRPARPFELESRLRDRRVHVVDAPGVVVGSNSDFDKLVVKPEKKESVKPAKSLVAIDGKILSEEEVEQLEEQYGVTYE